MCIKLLYLCTQNCERKRIRICDDINLLYVKKVRVYYHILSFIYIKIPSLLASFSHKCFPLVHIDQDGFIMLNFRDIIFFFCTLVHYFVHWLIINILFSVNCIIAEDFCNQFLKMTTTKFTGNTNFSLMN